MTSAVIVFVMLLPTRVKLKAAVADPATPMTMDRMFVLAIVTGESAIAASILACWPAGVASALYEPGLVSVADTVILFLALTVELLIMEDISLSITLPTAVTCRAKPPAPATPMVTERITAEELADMLMDEFVESSVEPLMHV
jgi:hypothetical protein